MMALPAPTHPGLSRPSAHTEILSCEVGGDIWGIGRRQEGKKGKRQPIIAEHLSSKRCADHRVYSRGEREGGFLLSENLLSSREDRHKIKL